MDAGREAILRRRDAGVAGGARVVCLDEQSGSDPGVVGHDDTSAVEQQAVALSQRAELAGGQHRLVGGIDQRRLAHLTQQTAGVVEDVGVMVRGRCEQRGEISRRLAAPVAAAVGDEDLLSRADDG